MKKKSYNMKKSIPVILVVGILAFFATRQGCTPDPVPSDTPVVIVKMDTEYVEKIVEKPVYVPGGIVYIPATDTEYVNVDTQAILKDYFATRVYSDTVNIDSIGWAYIQDTITRNQVIARQFKAKYTLPVITKTETIILPPVRKTELYLGAEGLFNKPNPLQYLGPTVLLKTKQDDIYTLGAGYTTGQGFTLKAGLLWKIKLK